VRRAVVLAVAATLLALPAVAMNVEDNKVTRTKTDRSSLLEPASTRPAPTLRQVGTKKHDIRQQRSATYITYQIRYCPQCDMWLGEDPVLRCRYCGAFIGRSLYPARGLY